MTQTPSPPHAPGPPAPRQPPDPDHPSGLRPDEAGAYEGARLQGLCHEGALEVAVRRPARAALVMGCAADDPPTSRDAGRTA